MNDCLFCKIANKEIAAQIEYESSHVIAFADAHPQADIHILIVPKEHIPSFLDIQQSLAMTIGEMFKTAQELILKKGVAGGYKIVFNGGNYQHVLHLHWHLLGGNIKL